MCAHQSASCKATAPPFFTNAAISATIFSGSGTLTRPSGPWPNRRILLAVLRRQRFAGELPHCGFGDPKEIFERAERLLCSVQFQRRNPPGRRGLTEAQGTPAGRSRSPLRVSPVLIRSDQRAGQILPRVPRPAVAGAAARLSCARESIGRDVPSGPAVALRLSLACSERSRTDGRQVGSTAATSCLPVTRPKPTKTDSCATSESQNGRKGHRTNKLLDS